MYLVYPPEGEPIRVADERLAEDLASRPGWRMELEPDEPKPKRPRKRTAEEE